jgi:hypothetical protein
MMDTDLSNFPDRVTVFGFVPALRSSLEEHLRAAYASFLPQDTEFHLSPPYAEETGSGNWIVLKVRDASQFPPQLWLHDHCLVLMAGDFTSPDWTVPPDPEPREAAPVRRRRPDASAPRIFKIPPHFLDPTNDDWAAIPFENKNLWAKIREVVFGQRVVRAASFPISDLLGPAFWTIVLCFVAFLICGIRLWVLRIFADD